MEILLVVVGATIALFIMGGVKAMKTRVKPVKLPLSPPTDVGGAGVGSVKRRRPRRPRGQGLPKPGRLAAYEEDLLDEDVRYPSESEEEYANAPRFDIPAEPTPNFVGSVCTSPEPTVGVSSYAPSCSSSSYDSGGGSDYSSSDCGGSDD